jgi:predicted glycogen debranching enzyme
VKSHGEHDEWLEPDGLGGFASGTACGIRTRRYHALLLTATTPPTGRMVLVNGFDAWIETPAGSFPLTSQRYEPGILHPDGVRHISEFTTHPWPRWVFNLEDGTIIEQTIVVRHGTPLVAISWRVLPAASRVPSPEPRPSTLLGTPRAIVEERIPNPGSQAPVLSVRPFLSGRDYHSLHHENDAFRFEPERRPDRIVWHPYDGVPAIHAVWNGDYHHQPDWYHHFRYDEERARGLDASEDLASPGAFRWNLADGDASLIFAAAPYAEAAIPPGTAAGELVATLHASERKRRQAFLSPLERAADAYIVTRGAGKTIVAGYPWFTDWGRDTFIALRGICLATDRIADARTILLEWTSAISKGMLPNRFPDRGEAPEFNSVDASLWFVIAVYEFFAAAARCRVDVSNSDRGSLEDAVDAVLSGYAGGTRYGIHLDEDGLIAAGVLGMPLTWMDARVDDRAMTPRIGKPVEVEALWLNALSLASDRSPRWKAVLARGKAAFQQRFWNGPVGALHDVVDVDHQPGTVDSSFRPNQIFALGGLPMVLVSNEQTAAALAAVEARLWTPLGLRSLAPDEPGYIGHYGGGALERDGAYHQGAVWPWLLTSFVDAWVRVRGGGPAIVEQARERFLIPLLRHLDEAGLGHISEIADGDPPYTPNGCPFQAWSVGEALRLDRVVLR